VRAPLAPGDFSCSCIRALESSRAFSPDPSKYSALWAEKNLGRDAFSLLVAIVLSQNTSDVNALKALRNLASAGLLSPLAIRSASEEAIADLVSPAGQKSSRARALKSIADFFIENPQFSETACIDVDGARYRLLEVWGVGEKTADVFLAVYCGAVKFFPVDRHIMRVTSRLVGKELSYSEASALWSSCAAGAADPRSLHLYLIDLGRRVCRPRSPLCGSCPLAECCALRKSLGQ